MRNRRADLIEWNDARSEGMGYSGTCYTLSYDRRADDCPLDGNAKRHWLVAADGFTVCSATAAQDAFAGSEGLEAYAASFKGVQPDQR
jgi:hypothetical protein